MRIELSDDQKKIYNKSGKFVVNACAGSGKTLTLSKKLVHLINNNKNHNKGIATLSFTNTAWKEIKKNLDHWNVNIEYPNFIGTFDKFINKYIFYQYYYLLDEFDERPTIVGDVGIPWKKGSYKRGDLESFFDVFSFNTEDDLIKMTEKPLGFEFKKENINGEINKNYEKLVKIKYKYFKQGFVTQDDINYFSFKLIKKYKFISKIIAHKFPIFLIEEAQDTNEIKMKILQIIFDNPSVKEFMFIGDFNQAIYEWNGAKPELFENLKEEYEVIDLKENWRSSQKICDFASKMVKTEFKAVNEEYKNFEFEPKILGYDLKNKDDELKNIINKFLKCCDECEIIIDSKNVAVLCKGNKLINELSGKKTYKIGTNLLKKSNMAYDLIYSKFLYENFQFKEAYEKLEYSLISLYINKKMVTKQEIKEYIEITGFFKMREECLELLKLMPPTKNISFNEWIDELKKILKKSDNNLKKLSYKLKKLEVDILIEDLFESNVKKEKYLLTTIHKAKGKSFDAVLLILLSKGQRYSYKKLVEKLNDGEKLHEELKNVYVGITRPRKILMVAVPKSDEKMWHDLFFDTPFSEDKNQSTLSTYF